jgi:GT2 family glycosyltransferase
MANEGRTHDLIERINSAVRDSRADFICLFDSRCSMLDEDWLDRLLETFDECTGQVGPQVVSSVDRSVIRGGLAGAGGRPHWNSDHAVCCHTRPDWLAIDALPWVCIVLRRNAFLEAGSFHEAHDGGPIRVDLDFCRRLAAHGWHSICNQSVTASFPAVAGAGEVARAFGASQFPGKQ